jgi:hypothetical protein
VSRIGALQLRDAVLDEGSFRSWDTAPLAKHLVGAAGSIVTEGHPLRRVTTHDSQQRDLVAELSSGFFAVGVTCRRVGC